jgi:hypothetical protein
MTTGAFVTNPGAGGATFAADLVAAENMPISKIDVGAAGASSLVTAANPMPVVLTAAQVTALAPLATQPVSAASLPLPAGAATETTLAALNTKTPAIGQALMAASSPVVLASNQSAIPVTLTSTTITGTQIVTNTPVTPTTTFTNSAASTNATAIKASAGTLWSVIVSNVNAASRFLKLFNLAVAPTVGTSVPVFTVAIPPGGTVIISGGSNGLRFSTGISFSITGAAGDLDATAISAADVKVATTFT